MKRYVSRRKATPKALVYAGLLALCTGALAYVGSQSYGNRQRMNEGVSMRPHSRKPLSWSMPVNPASTKSSPVRCGPISAYETLGFNEHLSFVTTEADQIKSVVSPRFYVCGQATTPEQLEAIGAVAAQAGYLKKQQQRLYEKIVAPEFDAIFSVEADETRRQLYQSPILEMIAAISRLPGVKPGSKIIIVSDLLQNSDSAHFCRVKGEMPPFRIFKQRPVYARLKPGSLKGITVEVLMIQRFGYGRPGLQYCSGEDELMAFWRDYLTENGAKPHFIRIRHGYTEG